MDITKELIKDSGYQLAEEACEELLSNLYALLDSPIDVNYDEVIKDLKSIQSIADMVIKSDESK